MIYTLTTLSEKPIRYSFQITGIYTAFEYHWESDYVFSGESHDFWELVLILEGTVEVVEDDKVYKLDPGMMICHAPGRCLRD